MPCLGASVLGGLGLRALVETTTHLRPARRKQQLGQLMAMGHSTVPPTRAGQEEADMVWEVSRGEERGQANSLPQAS